MPHTSIPLSQLKIGFIGAGRLGRALAWSLDTAGCRVHAVASRGAERAAEFAAPIAHCAQYPAQQLADECDLVFITTPDATIQAVADGIRWRAGQGVVHCSGATEVAVLAKAAADGALTGGFHPMQTFADPAAAARSLPGSTITIEAQGELNGILLALVERLGCAANQLPAGARARYHAAAGYASQYINVVLGEAVRIWQSWGATEAQALPALLPMVRGTLASIEAAGVAKGMPGPVSRGDAGTVEKHLAALGELDDDTLRLYRDLCLRSVSLAFAAGGIDADKAARIEGILRAV
jgi:predicted short-subunit dehydrogenase-like oxidoreductase (DUF2520 family)